MNYSKLNNLIDGKIVTKAKIVRKTGLARPSLDAILSGKDCKVSNLEKIAEALNVRMSYFFDEEDYPPVLQVGDHNLNAGSINKVEYHEGVPKLSDIPSRDSSEKLSYDQLESENKMLRALLDERERFLNYLLKERK